MVDILIDHGLITKSDLTGHHLVGMTATAELHGNSWEQLNKWLLFPGDRFNSRLCQDTKTYKNCDILWQMFTNSDGNPWWSPVSDMMYFHGGFSKSMLVWITSQPLREWLSRVLQIDLIFSAPSDSSGSGNQHLSRFSIAMTDTAAPGMAPKQAVLAAVASRTQREGSMAPDCRMLTSVVPEGAQLEDLAKHLPEVSRVVGFPPRPFEY